MPDETTTTKPPEIGAKVKKIEAPFGVNEVRLNARQWLTALAIVVLAAFLTPPLWEKIERFETGPDYRLPYELSKDYWLYSRYMQKAGRAVPGEPPVIVLGDSVVWGEYVLPDGTLSHFLNQQAGATNRFVNAGVNGLFPLALEGLVQNYATSLRDKKIILHCNPLWMTSPKADLSTDKEESFNHAELVPQFSPRIPCYKADANDRFAALITRNIGFIGWVNHLQNAYFGQKSLLKWTLEDDGRDPAHYPNTWKNPLAQIALRVPCAPANDPQRGPASPRHKAWSDGNSGATHFDWVKLNSSLQWAGFRGLVTLLQARGNQVFVIVGPFNEHMMDAESRKTCQLMRDEIGAWLSQNKIPYLAPTLLPSALYADASHPLTAGYALLAGEIYTDTAFQQWLKR